MLTTYHTDYHSFWPSTILSCSFLAIWSITPLWSINNPWQVAPGPMCTHNHNKNLLSSLQSFTCLPYMDAHVVWSSLLDQQNPTQHNCVFDSNVIHMSSNERQQCFLSGEDRERERETLTKWVRVIVRVSQLHKKGPVSCHNTPEWVHFPLTQKAHIPFGEIHIYLLTSISKWLLGHVFRKWMQPMLVELMKSRPSFARLIKGGFSFLPLHLPCLGAMALLLR